MPLLANLAAALAASCSLLGTAPQQESLTGGTPLPQLSAAQWLSGHAAGWRVGRLAEEPAVVIIEFPSLAEQGAAMNRMAALLEKTGAPRGQVLDDAALAHLIAQSGDSSATFYMGHDYDSAGLARFFTLAQAQGVSLNAPERSVLDVLMGTGVISARQGDAAGYYSATLQALVTFSAAGPIAQASPDDETVDADLRESTFLHEISHGRYFTRPIYQAHCEQFWRQTLTEPQREHIRRYLAAQGYDRQNEPLMINEAQAYLMNTLNPSFFSAPEIGMTPAQLKALRDQFWRTLPPD